MLRIAKLYFFFIVTLGIGLSILPPLVDQIGGDIIFQSVVIRCFSEQFWQGDLYPHWCFAVNDGLGAAIFTIYFPLAFYATALFYPLTWIGFDAYHLYTLMLGIAASLTVFTTYLWLKDIVTPERALMGALLFLFVPYRFEAMYFRSAFAEPWGMIFVPLVFLYARRIAQGKPAMLGYGVSLAMLALTHIPLTSIAGLFSALYILFMADKPITRAIKQLFLGGLLGLSLSAFYLVQSFYYKQFTASEAMGLRKIPWANTFISITTQMELGQLLLLITIGLSILVLIVLSFVVLRGRQRIADRFVSREITTFVAFFILSVFLSFSVSAPLYRFTKPLSDVVFPWRMQMMFVMCFTYFMVIIMQYLLKEKQVKTWRTDFVIMMVFMWFAALLNVSTQANDTIQLSKNILPLNPISTFEYRSVWTDPQQLTFEAINKRAHATKPPRVAYIKDKGQVNVLNWGWDGISFEIDAVNPATLRIDHHYFPLWQATIGGRSATLYPEKGSGLMLLDVPAGKNTIHITRDVFAPNRLVLLGSAVISLLSACSVFYYFLSSRRRRALSLMNPAASFWS